MNPLFRCSAASEQRGEVLLGTASTVRAFLLVEAPGSWGVDAVGDSRLPPAVKRYLTVQASRHRVRPLMIRRHGRSQPGRLTVFAAFADTRSSWIETTSFSDPLELLDIDLSRLGSGRSPHLTPHTSPLFLVCTHGRHDACCAERGRPLAAALHGRFPLEAWEVSHIGGDRFAGNMLVLPEGLYYGRLTPDSGVEVAERHHAGHLDLVKLRGRCGYPFAVQAAETFLRRQLGWTEIDALALSTCHRKGDLTDAVFTAGERSWQVRVSSTSSPPEQLTCRALLPRPGTAHTLVGIQAT